MEDQAFSVPLVETGTTLDHLREYYLQLFFGFVSTWAFDLIALNVARESRPLSIHQHQHISSLRGFSVVFCFACQFSRSFRAWCQTVVLLAVIRTEANTLLFCSVVVQLSMHVFDFRAISGVVR